jgi:hypothetical protein
MANILFKNPSFFIMFMEKFDAHNFLLDIICKHSLFSFFESKKIKISWFS